jgi:hypothetical protein
MSCAAPTITVGGVTMSTSDFENIAELVNTISGDGGDPTLDEFTENIANGNNAGSTTGVQIPITGSPPVQTSLPTPSPVPANSSNDTPPPVLAGVVVAPGTWNGDYDAVLSPNFKVRAFTVNAVFPNQLIDYGVYTMNSRFTNLKGLAVNVAEPLLAKFGKFNINSGLRNKTSTPSGVSQHITGQAMDIQFSGWTYARYWENAAWVKDNIPYDQFIYEHSDKTGLVWYHLSYNNAGGRAISDRTKVMTMYRNHYDPGLKNYG